MSKRVFSRLLLIPLFILPGLVWFFYLKPIDTPREPTVESLKLLPNTIKAQKFAPNPKVVGEETKRETQSTEENTVLVPLPLSKIPGGGVVLAQRTIADVPTGAEALANILADDKMTEEKKAETLAAMALNLKEDSEVRQEALDQWLRLIPEEGESLLSTLAKDSRVTNEMAAVLIKDTFTRTVSIQAEVALILFSHKEPEIRQLAREQLLALTGIDHKDNKNAWAAEIKNLLSRQPKN
jgi:hypothetical protein